MNLGGARDWHSFSSLFHRARQVEEKKDFPFIIREFNFEVQQSILTRSWEVYEIFAIPCSMQNRER
jgi:hypothetical protein